jgi:polyisoprenoid-binding protein YceI
VFVRHGPMPLLVLVGLTSGIAGLSPAQGSGLAPAASGRTALTAATDPIIRFVTADSGNVARYRVRERLAALNFPSDAVGSTGAVTGTIAIGPDGKFVPGESKFVVDIRPLKSDQARRDRSVQVRVLDGETFPTVTLAPTSVTGLPVPPPTTGTVSFDLVGDLTVHGTTRPTTWHVTATVDGKQLSGTAATAFTFADFKLVQPRVAVVLSVGDTIKLEYGFRLVRK